MKQPDEIKWIIGGNKTNLKEVLGLHLKWLNNENYGKRADLQDADLQRANLQGADLQRAYLQRANLQGADLRGADLRDAYLQRADLRDADLRDADLRGANLDFSCMPLWCGDLKANYDDKQIIQQVYHVASHIKFSKNIKDEDLKALLESNLFKKVANKFHRVKECGKI